jgi:ribonuclease HII
MKIYIDEAGRGPLAGPVYVGLILEDWSLKNSVFKKFGDSKQIAPKKREELFDGLENSSIVWSYGSSSAAHIDRFGIVKALQQAICKGLWNLSWQEWIIKVNILRDWLAKNNILLVLDGNHDFGLSKLLHVGVQTIIKWDSKVKQIGAASIVAKVLRDREMFRLHKKYPTYGFAKHMGYGTQTHRDAIQKYGLTKIHRKSFCH